MIDDFDETVDNVRILDREIEESEVVYVYKGPKNFGTIKGMNLYKKLSRIVNNRGCLCLCLEELSSSSSMMMLASTDTDLTLAFIRDSRK